LFRRSDNNHQAEKTAQQSITAAKITSAMVIARDHFVGVDAEPLAQAPRNRRVYAKQQADRPPFFDEAKATRLRVGYGAA
jgi:hypothetical protein